MSTMISANRDHTLRVKVCDDLYERLCTRAAQLRMEPEAVARTLLERAIRRLPVARERAA